MSKLVVIVCRGNIGRSPFAEAVIKQRLSRDMITGIQVTSRGTQGTRLDPKPVKYPNITYYEELYKDSKHILDHFGVDLSTHVSKVVSSEDIALADIVLAVDDKTKSSLGSLFPDRAHKLHLISELVGDKRNIIDPEGVSGADKQRQIFTDLYDILTAGFPELLRLLDQTQ